MGHTDGSGEPLPFERITIRQTQDNNRLSGQTVTAYRYLVECGLWAKRAYEADAMEYGEQEAAIYIEDFPDAVETLNESLKLLPNGPEAVAAINWYRINSKPPDE